MSGRIIKKIEEDILRFFDNSFDELTGKLLPLIKKIKEVEREFTGVGAYISFINKDKPRVDKELANKRFGGDIFIVSKEFMHDVPISIVFDKDGVLDYIELEMGMKDTKYPKEYRIEIKPVNVIKGKEVTTTTYSP